MKKPLTPLPWSYGRVDPSATSDAQEPYCPWFDSGGPRAVTVGRSACIHADDMEYIAHAANAYPKLVEALRKCYALANEHSGKGAETVLTCDELLRELGEKIE